MTVVALSSRLTREAASFYSIHGSRFDWGATLYTLAPQGIAVDPIDEIYLK